MSNALKAGARLSSAVCTTQVIIIKAPAGPVSLECGGKPMLGAGESAPEGATPAPGADSGTQLGKRYVDAAESIEVLCTKAGAGSLSLDGEALTLKAAKPLPSSD